jgi:hypothetical protein
VSEEGQGMGRWAQCLHFPICLHGAYKGNFTFLTSTYVHKQDALREPSNILTCHSNYYRFYVFEKYRKMKFIYVQVHSRQISSQ